MVSLAGPPPTRPIRPRHAALRVGTELVRIYKPQWLGPTGFNHRGPFSRFDHHAPQEPPAHDPARAVYYAAESLQGCVVEVFGDTGVIESGPYNAAVVSVLRELTVLDLTKDGAWDAGSVAALTKHADREYSQAWARHFYQDHEAYGLVDGMKYENAHNSEVAYVLFERAAGVLRLELDVRLDDASLRGTLADIANTLGLFLE